MTNFLRNLKKILLVSAVLLESPLSLAVSTFITEEAHIQPKGHFELEIWPEFNYTSESWTNTLQFMLGYAFTERFEIIWGVGHEYHHRHQISQAANSLLIHKWILFDENHDQWPLTAILVGHGGWHHEHQVSFAFMAHTWELLHHHLLFHLNYGWRYGDYNNEIFSKPYWAINAEMILRPERWHYIVEAYSGLPFDSMASPIAYQVGGRWFVDPHHQWDFTLGTQEETKGFQEGTGHYEYWLQVGWRKIID